MEAFSKDELLQLLRAARAARERDWLMILIAFWHGLRASELVGLTRDSVEDGQLKVQRLKGSNRTVQPLITHPDPLLDEAKPLFDYIENMLSTQLIFPVSRRTFHRIIQKHGRTAGLPLRKLHPHSLKHSIAMQTIKHAGIENVRQHLGHKSISSTGAYLKVNDADASAAVRGALD